MISLFFKKDLRKQRYLLGLYCFTLMACLGVVMLEMYGNSWMRDVNDWSRMAMNVGALLRYLMILIIIPLVIHDDPLVGATAFWKTRPITNSQLFWEKLLFVGLFFVAVPVLTSLSFLAVYGAPLSFLASVAHEILFDYFGFVALCMLIASLTRHFAQYILALIIVVVVLMTRVWLQPILVKFSSEEISFSIGYSRFLASVFFAYLALGCLIVHQYITLNYRRTIIFSVVVIVGSLLISTLWRYDFFQKNRVVLPVTEAKIWYEVKNSLQITKSNLSSDSNQKVYQVNSALPLKNQPPERVSLLARVQDVGILYAKDTKIKGPDVQFDRKQFNLYGEEFAVPIQHALGDYLILNPGSAKANRYDLFQADEDVYQQWKERRGYYQAKGQYNQFVYHSDWELPLRDQVRQKRGLSQLTINGLKSSRDRVEIVLTEMSFVQGSNQDYLRMDSGDYAMKSAVQEMYVLCHPGRKEALLAGAPKVRRFENDKYLKDQEWRLEFNIVDSQNRPLVVVDENWLKDAVLIRLEAELVGKVDVDIRYDQFYLPEYSGK